MSGSTHIADAWREHGPALAAFAFTSLINRTDVWGQYVTPAMRERYGKTLTGPAKSLRGIESLSAWHLSRHFCGEDPGHVMGLHTTSSGNTSRWAAMDFDMHDAEGVPLTEERRESVAAAFDWCVDLMGERVSLLLEDSDGNGGRHLWCYFAEPVDTASVFVWLAYIANGCARVHGYRPETYPKQPRLPRNASGVQQYGNWLRLPGRHHTRDHWSRLARPGEPWAEGEAAVRLFLEWPATPVEAIPPVAVYPVRPITSPPPRAMRLRDELPKDRATAIQRYLSKVPHGAEGTGRSDHLYRVACFLRFDMQCSDAEALPILHAWNAGNVPPLPDAKVFMTWQNAAQYGGGGRRVA